MTQHYNQRPVRRAEFINPPNTLKSKVGTGGLSEDILNKAQKLLEENTHDFRPLADMYLNTLAQGIEQAKTYSLHTEDSEGLIVAMIYPAMQLKANGGMFKYSLVTKMADKLVQFLEVIAEPEIEALEIILAFHTSLKAVVHGEITGEGGQNGKELLGALNTACMKYFERHPPKIDFL